MNPAREDGGKAAADIIRELTDYVRSETGEIPPLDAHLLESGLLDSMAMVLFVSYVEQEYDFEIDVDSLSAGALSTIRSAAEHIAGRLGLPAAETRGD